MGEVVVVDLTIVHTRQGEFHRAIVNLNLANPLARIVPLSPEGYERMIVHIKYEKMPKHCEHCGLMGHVYTECGSGEYEVADLQFGKWMIANEIF